jgi:hypothetical protein
VAVALAVTSGRAEGQGLPVRVTIGARANVVPLPAAQTVTVDSALTAPLRTVAADTASATPARRQRRVVVSYPGN